MELGYVCGAMRVSTDPTSATLGPRAHVVGFLDGLRGNGIEPRVYLAGDEVRRAQGSSTAASSPWLRRAAVDSARLALRPVLQRRARSAVGEVDVVYERQATFQDLGRAWRRDRTPWVIESNGPFWYEASAQRKTLAWVRAAKRLELASYRDADLVVAVSATLRDIIVREGDVAHDKVLVLPNATDTDRFDPSGVVPRRVVGEDEVAVGFVGYLAPWAALDRLVRAVAAARREGLALSAVIVGDGPSADDLAALVAELDVAEHVVLTGRVGWADVPALMAGFDLAYSGQVAMAVGGMYHSPQKLYEYLAMGLPAVASHFPDAAELLGEGRGWTFDPDDEREPLATLRRAAGATDRAERGTRGRAEVVAHHTWRARTATLLDELRRRGVV